LKRTLGIILCIQSNFDLHQWQTAITRFGHQFTIIYLTIWKWPLFIRSLWQVYMSL